MGDGVNRQRVLRFRLESEFVRVKNRVRKRALVWPNMLNMPETAYDWLK